MVNLEDKTGECIHILRIGKCFLNRLQKRVTRKDNTDKLGYIKVKNFHSSEVTFKSEKKKEITEWEKMSVLHTSDKEFISNI